MRFGSLPLELGQRQPQQQQQEQHDADAAAEAAAAWWLPGGRKQQRGARRRRRLPLPPRARSGVADLSSCACLTSPPSPHPPLTRTHLQVAVTVGEVMSSGELVTCTPETSIDEGAPVAVVAVAVVGWGDGGLVSTLPSMNDRTDNALVDS